MGFLSTKIEETGSLTFGVTNDCGAKCGHCLMSSGFNRQGGLTYEQMSSAIASFHDVYHLHTVVFTGGEPTLMGEDLLNSIAFASSLGIATRIVTNAQWATTDEETAYTLRKLREAGLDEINFSVDDYHAVWIPIEQVVRAWNLSKGLGFASVVAAIVSGPSSRLNAQRWRELIDDNTVPEIVNQGRARKVPPDVAPDGTRYVIATGRFYRLGRAKNMTRSLLHFPESQDDIWGRCPLLGDPIVVMADGHVSVCCGMESQRGDLLDIGLIEWPCTPEQVRSIVAQGEQEPVVHALATLGPAYLKELALAHNPDLKFRDEYVSACEICHELSRRPDMRKALAEVPLGTQQMILRVPASQSEVPV